MGALYKKTCQVDKTTMQNIGYKESLIYTNGTVYRNKTMNASYNYSVKPYPLSVGKTWTVTVNITTTGSLSEQKQTITETYSYIYKVEKVESIKVPAGTFQCFKIVTYSYYSDTNLALYTEWVTDVSGGVDVKQIDNDSGITTELVSYSLSKQL